MTNIEHQSFLNIRVGCRNWTVGISHRQGERKRNQMFTLVMNEMEADRKKSFKLQTIDGAFVSKFCHLLDRICTCKMECPMELSTWKGTDENEWCGFNDIHQSNGEVTRTPPQFLSSLRVKPEPNRTKQNKTKIKTELLEHYRMLQCYGWHSHFAVVYSKRSCTLHGSIKHKLSNYQFS